jgi:hypothetical protein
VAYLRQFDFTPGNIFVEYRIIAINVELLTNELEDMVKEQTDDQIRFFCLISFA